MNNKGLFIIVAVVTFTMATFNSVSMANTEMRCDPKQMNSGMMHDHMKQRLDRLAGRLEIKSSQQAAWEEFSKSVETLADRNSNQPDANADAAAISRYHAERATEIAKKLTVIADTTAKLQKVLNEDQRKILNQVSHRFLHQDHEWNTHGHGSFHENHDWEKHGDADNVKPSH